MPNIPIGQYTGEEKSVVTHDINIAIFSILQSLERQGLPILAPIRASALLFVDEAHHSMTRSRMKLLAEIVDPLAIRILQDLSRLPTLSRYRPHR